ncbi:MAG: CoA-binding protein [Desulfobacterota bacterium]|nr:CoA-binding protein [Thermodesulfobacteriota bacterium]
MDFFFNPNGIAVVGATPEANRGGRNLLANLLFGYRGPIYPVNPKYEEVLGLKCYPKVSEIEGPLDLVIIFVPARSVPQILEDCAAKGVRGVIIESGGFAEVGPEGRRLQEECLSIARKGGIRIWGPNCMGIIDTGRRYIFSFVIPQDMQEALRPGRISLVVQSGLLSGGFIITLMGNRIVGLSKVCSIGNKSDVNENEILEYLLGDPSTEVVCLYLESFADGRRFFELAASSDKPIVLLKGGKTPSGAKASLSHTASLAGRYELIKGILKQAGVIEAEDFFEMMDIARVLEKGFHLKKPKRERPRIAILTYSGASGIVTSDHLERHGLALANLSPRTLKRLKALSPDWMPIQNPVDYWPAMEKNGPLLTYREGISALHDDSEVDGIIVHLYAGHGVWQFEPKAILSGVKDPRKPILFWLIGPEKIREATRLPLEEEGWPTFYEIGRTVRAMASLFERV